MWSSLSWRHPWFNAHHASATLLKRQLILCRCGKNIRPDLDMMRRIKAAFEILKAPCSRTSAITARVANMVLIHGRNTTTKQETHFDGCSKGKRQYTSIWDRWQRDETSRESQLAINWSDAWVKYSDHIAKNGHLPYSAALTKGKIQQSTLLAECQRRWASATSTKKTRISRCKESKGWYAEASTTRIRNSFYPRSWKATLAQSAWSFNATVSWVAEHWLGWTFRRRTPSAGILLPGHQVHPGGPRPPGLRIGISTSTWSEKW